METNTILALLGGMGVGSLINNMITHYTNQKSKQKERRYEEKKAAYIGLLTSLHDAALNPSEKTAKSYALWQAKCQIFGSEKVTRFTQAIVDTNDGPKKDRETAFNLLLTAIQQDLDKS
ncbi:hypothetical protein [Legionella drancourtii]|uniref:Uncharacterized protein n=1 Tax=Legionella drancourtii LLAP12 TaxID=658187 RepID=G9EKG2_9GAMM|nr:hypothetical protein [Legionella drancourtii]EHL32313.1 hypothetical protein LDG_5694 [Legionella drancourtii LLAP12]